MLSWEAAVAEDWLGKWAKNQMLINVSTRKFARSVRLPEGDIPAPMGSGMLKIGRFLIDGIHMDEDLILVAAIGVDAKGDKHPVGATENAATIQALVNNLVERRLDPAAEYLATNVCRTGVCGPTFLLRRGAGLAAERRRAVASWHGGYSPRRLARRMARATPNSQPFRAVAPHSNQSRLGAVSVAGKRNFEARDKGAETAVGIHLGARRDQASSTPCATPNCRPRASRTSGATDAVSLVFRGALADKKGVRRNKTAVNTGRGRLLAGVSLQMRQQRVERPKADPFIPDRACFSVLTRGPQRARELLTIRSRTSCRPKTMTTSIGSKSAAEPHDRAAKESQLQRESI